jgi:hypothetical protein
MHGFNPPSKNPELQGLISRLERHFPTAIQLLTLTSKAPSNQPRSSQEAPSLSRGATFPILDVAPPEVVSLPYQNPHRARGSQLSTDAT